MDNFFINSVDQEEDNFWDLIAGEISGDDEGEKNVSVLNRSAFRSYKKDTEQRMVSVSPEISSSKVNVKMKMVNLLRKNWEEKKNAVAPEKERCRRHMMKERQRRERQKQNYLALRSLLPNATKSDKNSIVEKTINEIEKLQRLKNELERRIKVMEANSQNLHENRNETKVRFNLQEPLCRLESMVEILQCLKSMGTKLKTVKANFSPHELSTTMNIETKIMAEEVEKRVERRLQETEWKLLFLQEPLFFND